MESKSNREEELLRQQLELLAERSKDCIDEMLPVISSSMVELYQALGETRLNL